MDLSVKSHISTWCTQAGTWMVSAVFVEDVIMRMRTFYQHMLYLRAILGTRDGVTMALLGLLTVSQAASAAVLVVPRLHRTLGTEVPSIALGCTLAVEFVLYHGFTDWEIVARMLLTCLSLAAVALTRRDKKARAECLGVPVSDVLLTAEAWLRHWCTRGRAVVACPVLCVITALKALIANRYWSRTGASFEMHRTSFMLCVSICSLLMFLAGQDRSTGNIEEAMDRARILYRRAAAFVSARMDSQRASVASKSKRL